MVGAGPAGSACARSCAEQGLSVCMIEEHPAIGYPVQCAGLLSVSALSVCRVSDRSRLHHVSGARVVSSMGPEIAFDAGTTRAWVVDRGILDREMAMLAAREGVEVRVRTAFAGMGDGAVVTRGVDGQMKIPFRLLIAADGPRSSIARKLGMARARTFLSGLQAEVVREMDPRLVEIHPDASPEFFGWAIPSGTGRARIGLCGTHDVRERFLSFMRNMGSRDCLHLVSGTIPLGVMPKTYGHRTLFIGDAAGFAKPTSGGGIYTGVRSGIHAATTAAEACRLGRYDDATLSSYEKAWRSDFGKELALGYRLFRLRQQLNPSDIAELVGTLDDPAIIRDIIMYGDIDRPSGLVRKMLKNPKLIPLLGLLFKSGVRQIIK